MSGAWTRKEGKNPKGGLNAKGRAAAKAEGMNLKPPAPNPKTEKDANRRKSFCARMSGMKAKLTSSETAKDPDSRINKSLRAWNCADGGAVSDDRPVWDKPRPKDLGEPKKLTPSQKASAKASAKAAGRPWPNMIDNIRAARRADGGPVVEDALRLANERNNPPQPPERPLELSQQDAANAFPSLWRNVNPVVKYNVGRQPMWAETYTQGEEGDPERPETKRPAEFPLERTGIEVYNPRNKGVDLGLELLHADPKAIETRNALLPTITKGQRDVLTRGWEDYDESIREKLSEQKAMENVVDAMERTYLANKTGLPHHQGPQRAIDAMKLTGDQKKLLDKLYGYTQTGKYADGGAVSDALRIANAKHAGTQDAIRRIHEHQVEDAPETVMREYYPSLKERIAASLMGDERPSVDRRRTSEGLSDVAYYLPGIGEAIAGDQIGRSGVTGDYATTLRNLIGVIPGLGKYAANKMLPKIPERDGGRVNARMDKNKEWGMSLADGGAASATDDKDNAAQQATAEQYPTYEVGGQTYHRINPDVPEWQEKATTWALDKAARMMAPTMKADPEPGLSTKARLYERAVLNRDPSTITEREMGPEVMSGAAQAAMRSLAEGRGTIHYHDYGPDREQFDNPAREVFGAARVERSPVGGATIRDTFNFNNTEQGYGNTVPRILKNPMGAATWLARRALPEGTGPQVSVNIPQEKLLEAKQGIYGENAPAMLGAPLSRTQFNAPISRNMRFSQGGEVTDALRLARDRLAYGGLPNSYMQDDRYKTFEQMGGTKVDPVSQTVGRFMPRMMAHESANDPTLQNKVTSAAGLAQFTTPTWRKMVAGEPETVGKSQQEIDEMRKSGTTSGQELQVRMAEKLARANAADLQKRNLPVTVPNLYAEHFGGPHGAQAVAAPANKPLRGIFSDLEMTKNPELAKMGTAGNFRAWTERMMSKPGQTTQGMLPTDVDFSQNVSPANRYQNMQASVDQPRIVAQDQPAESSAQTAPTQEAQHLSNPASPFDEKFVDIAGYAKGGAVENALRIARQDRSPMRLHQTLARTGYENGGKAPYGAAFIGDDKVVLGSPHGEPIELSDDLKSRVQGIAKQHGAYYEGNAGDVEANKALIPEYKGSWDEAHGRNVKGYPVEYLAPMFSNVDVNKPHETYADPEKTIMASLIANQDKGKYFGDRRFDEKALRDFLQQGSEKDVDLLKMAQEKATAENLRRFFQKGESLMWPDNWQEYPHNLGKIAKRFEDARNQYLLDAPPGVYVAGAGHLPELRRLKKDFNTVGGERAGYAEGGVPDEASQEKFLKEQLQGSAPQYDPEAGMHTAKEAGLMAAGMAPGAGIATAAGQFPTADGGKEPSMAEDWRKGEYLSAGLKGLGAAGDIVSAVPVVGTAAGLAMKAPLAAKLAMAAAPMAKAAKDIAPVAKAAEAAAPAAQEYQRLINPAGFYSRAHEVAMTALPDQPRTWQEMRALMMKQPGMREEEMYWSGLHPEAHDPSHKLTREEIAAQVEKNFPKVSPIVKKKEHSFPYSSVDQFQEAISRAEGSRNWDEVERLQNAWEEFERYGAGEMLPMHEQYTVPGGKNYNERVLTHEYNPEGTGYTAEQFRHESHLGDINNPILHTRNSEREIPGRGKVWHQEEVQSDWAQQGREKGFKENLTGNEVKQYDELNTQRRDLEKVVANGDDADPAVQQATENLAQVNRQMEALANKMNAARSGIPQAPHVRETEHWLDLAAKDTLKNAIEGGYDHIFITGGQEQAKRWSNELRKAVDNVRWQTPNPETQHADVYAAAAKLNKIRNEWSQIVFEKPYEDLHTNGQEEIDKLLRQGGRMVEIPEIAPEGSKVVYAKPVGSDQEHRFVVKPVEGQNGKPRVEVVDSSIPAAKGETLAAVVGNDLAKRIMAEESGEQAMKGYRMGSEGYTQTYERKYPSSFKKLIKGLDPQAKVEGGEMPFGRGKIDELTASDLEELFESKLTPEQVYKWQDAFMDMSLGMQQEGMPFKEAVERYAPSDLQKYLMENFGNENVGGTWVQITPKMREEYARLKQKHGAVFPAYRKGGRVEQGLDRTQKNQYTGSGIRNYALNVARKVVS